MPHPRPPPDSTILAFVEDVRFRIPHADAAGEFPLRPRGQQLLRRIAPTLGVGVVIEYMFPDREGEWFRGTLRTNVRENGTAHVVFDDGDSFINCPVKGDLGGAQLRFPPGEDDTEVIYLRRASATRHP